MRENSVVFRGGEKIRLLGHILTTVTMRSVAGGRIWWRPGEPGHHPPRPARHVLPLQVETPAPGSSAFFVWRISLGLFRFSFYIFARAIHRGVYILENNTR